MVVGAQVFSVSSLSGSKSKVSDELVKQGTADVGNVEILDCVWNDTISSSFLMTTSETGTNVKPLGTHVQDQTCE